MRVEAWAPGHATLFFMPVERGGVEGSVGAGVCLSDGVTTLIDTDGSGGSEVEVARAVLDGMSVDGVFVRHGSELPREAGLGSSGAVALSTALAAAAAEGRGFNEAAEAAHRAEVECGTGLGDVAAQCLGGVVIRRGPGVPPSAELDRVPVPPLPARYEVLGERPTRESIPEIDDLPELEEVSREPTLERAFELGRGFGERSGLVTEEVGERVESYLAEGFDAAQAHLGETVLAVGEGLETGCRVSPVGGHVLEVSK